MSVSSIPIRNIPIEFAGPFSNKGDLITLQQDPEDPTSYSGSVAHKFPGYRYETTVTSLQPFHKSNNAWPIPVPAQSLEVEFPPPTKNTADSDTPPFSREQGSGWITNRKTLIMTGTVKGFVDKKGKALAEPPREAKFNVSQRLFLDSGIADVYGDEENERFQEASVSTVYSQP
jgi:hypothetical protein